MARILVVEDEPDLQRLLEFNLTQAGHETRVCAGGQAALAAARASPPELVLLDIMLPDLSGTEVLKALKREPATAPVPVIMLTARGSEVDRVVGLELGAEDYVVKPFSVREVLLRIEGVLRRSRAAAEVAAHAPATMTFGPLRVDRGAHRVWVGDAEVLLTALELRLLVTLLERKNRVQSRTALLDDVWGIEADITTRTVDTHVKRLREKLGPAGVYIETVRGVGYRFAEHPREDR